MDGIRTAESGTKATVANLKEVERAARYPIVFDCDCPELSPRLQKAFRCVVKHRNRLSTQR